MTKDAILIIGGHGSGKTTFTNHTLKPALGMRPRQRHQIRNGKRVCVKSQTLQEARLSLDDLSRYRDFDVLILPSWPDGVGDPQLSEIIQRLRSFGFTINEIAWQRGSDANATRDRIIGIVDR